MTKRPGYDFRGRQIAPATRADWRHDARPTNYDSARVTVLNRRIIELLDALDEAEADLAQAWDEGAYAARKYEGALLNPYRVSRPIPPGEGD